MRKRILFQGDSITDAGRMNMDAAGSSPVMGVGYANYVAAALGAACPMAYSFHNRGISGNRSVDLYARVKRDILNLKPDYLSILIGINDVWHEITEQDGVCAEKYERVCSDLIEEILAALPNIRIMILEPFVLFGSGTAADYPLFRAETEARAAAAKRVAERYRLTFVPLQAAFDAAAQTAPSDYWLIDGVHPTHSGHALIAKAWLEAFKTL